MKRLTPIDAGTAPVDFDPSHVNSRGPRDNVTGRPERDEAGNLPGSRVRLVKVDRMGNDAGNPAGGSDAGPGAVS